MPSDKIFSLFKPHLDGLLLERRGHAGFVAATDDDVDEDTNVYLVIGKNDVQSLMGSMSEWFGITNASSFNLTLLPVDDSVPFLTPTEEAEVVLPAGASVIVARPYAGCPFAVALMLGGDSSGPADTATKLATARAIELSGAASGSVEFDGSADADIVVTLADPTAARAGGVKQQAAIADQSTAGGAVADPALLQAVIVALRGAKLIAT